MPTLKGLKEELEADTRETIRMKKGGHGYHLYPKSILLYKPRKHKGSSDFNSQPQSQSNEQARTLTGNPAREQSCWFDFLPSSCLPGKGLSGLSFLG